MTFTNITEYINDEAIRIYPVLGHTTLITFSRFTYYFYLASTIITSPGSSSKYHSCFTLP